MKIIQAAEVKESLRAGLNLKSLMVRGPKNLTRMEMVLLAFSGAGWLLGKKNHWMARRQQRNSTVLRIKENSKEYVWFCEWLMANKEHRRGEGGRDFSVHAMRAGERISKGDDVPVIRIGEEPSKPSWEKTLEQKAAEYRWALVPESSGEIFFRGTRITVGKGGAEEPTEGSGEKFWSMLNRSVVLNIHSRDDRKVTEFLVAVCLAGLQVEEGNKEEYIPGVYLQTPWNDWVRRSNVATNRRPVLPAGVYEELLEDALDFTSRRAWYESVGVPYRRGYMFHGLPGTGKTTLAITLAADLKRDLFVIRLQGLSDNQMIEAFARARENAIVLIDDIDCLRSTHDRETGDSGAAESAKGPTLGTLLSVIDGPASPEGRILIATTNYLEVLDEALLRPGRFDEKVEFSHATAHQVGALAERFGESPGDAGKLAGTWPTEKISMAEVQERLIVRMNAREKTKKNKKHER